MDKRIGQLVDYLEEEGWLENAVVVVASDNGGCPMSGGINTPLRGTKQSNWEGGVKVKKNRARAGVIANTLCSSLPQFFRAKLK